METIECDCTRKIYACDDVPCGGSGDPPSVRGACRDGETGGRLPAAPTRAWTLRPRGRGNRQRIAGECCPRARCSGPGGLRRIKAYGGGASSAAVQVPPALAGARQAPPGAEGGVQPHRPWGAVKRPCRRPADNGFTGRGPASPARRRRPAATPCDTTRERRHWRNANREAGQ